GALDAYGWHGKRFDSAEDVHPLVFRAFGGRLVHLDPSRVIFGVPLLMRFPVLKSAPVAAAVRAMLPLLSTRRSRARLRMMAHGGRVTAALVYDSVPIIDVFRRLDADTVLGLMDMKGMQQPFFFVLQRERTT